MALLLPKNVSHISPRGFLPLLLHPYDKSTSLCSSLNSQTNSKRNLNFRSSKFKHFAISYRLYANESDNDAEDYNFDEAVALFNDREYYKCHDYLEAIWHKAEEPTRTLVHGILQCAVGFHHLFNQNHRGAMMELGEGLCKLKKMDFKSGPFHQFEQEIAAVLEFIYQTQIELAACSDDLCLTMDQSEISYQLLGRYAAGQHVYDLHNGPDKILYIVFCLQRSYEVYEPQKVKLPTLTAATEHLMTSDYK
ncbi:TTHA0068 domain containing protein [Quillaja saponaria]|uniref:TTHA0068 domain containing protein n=1 Tax=Quillaja saponaria TaxID=32244 RepID=A0AAD7Q7W0_QUISA|nr:TTHA0068 domain containing protein [Quillaja saponaria]